MQVSLFYMNQGGGGVWGAVSYQAYDILCIAEMSKLLPTGFSIFKDSQTIPRMSVLLPTANAGKRVLTEPVDMDTTCSQVRPIYKFQIVGLNVSVVFVHLKSGNQNVATNALSNCADKVFSSTGFTANTPTLWIGDFNRADDDVLQKKAEVVYLGGGNAKWYLDRVYKSGDWGNIDVQCKMKTQSTDHSHVGLEIIMSKP